MTQLFASLLFGVRLSPAAKRFTITPGTSLRTAGIAGSLAGLSMLQLPLSTIGRTPWSESDDAILVGMRDGRCSFLLIGQMLKRSERACARRFELLDADRCWQAMQDDMDRQSKVLRRG